MKHQKTNSCLVVSFDIPYTPYLNHNHRNEYTVDVIPCFDNLDDYHDLTYFKSTENSYLKKGYYDQHDTNKDIPFRPQSYITEVDQFLQNCGLYVRRGSLIFEIQLLSNGKGAYHGNHMVANEKWKTKNGITRKNIILAGSRLSKPRLLKYSDINSGPINYRQARVPIQALKLRNRHGMSSKNDMKQCGTKENNVYSRLNVKSLNRVYGKYSSPKHFIAHHYNTTDHILFGIVIENHSKYKLINPKSTNNNICCCNKIIPNTLNSVDGGNVDVVIVHNNVNDYNGVCGSIAWEIDGPISKREIIVSYKIPYRGSCGKHPKDRGNMHSINITEPTKDVNEYLRKTQDTLSFEKTSCTKTGDGSIFLRGQISVLTVANRNNRLKGLSCAPILKLQVFTTDSQSIYIVYYIAISVSLITSLIICILMIIIIRKCKGRQNENHDSEMNVIRTNENQTENISDTFNCSPNKEECQNSLENIRLVNADGSLGDIPDLMDQTNIPQVYMSQASYDMVQNYRPAIPMPFRNKTKSGSDSALSKHTSMEIPAVLETIDNECMNVNQKT